MKEQPIIFVIMGVSGSGKSTVARTLANLLNMHFVEADDYHPASNIAHMASGKPLTDAMREPWIELLRNEISTLIEQHKPSFLAYSGLRASHRQRIRSVNGPIQFILLNPSKEVVAKRLQSRQQHFFPQTLLDSQYAALQLPQNEPDVLTISDHGDIEHLTQQIVAASPALLRRQSSLANQPNSST